MNSLVKTGVDVDSATFFSGEMTNSHLHANVTLLLFPKDLFYGVLLIVKR